MCLFLICFFWGGVILDKVKKKQFLQIVNICSKAACGQTISEIQMIKASGQKFSGEIKFFAVFSIACFLGLCFHCKLELETERCFILHALCVEELRAIFMLSGSQQKGKAKKGKKERKNRLVSTEKFPPQS